MADVYHDSVRVALERSLGAERMKRSHGALADWLRGRPETTEEPERLVRHLAAAGRREEATELAPIAAQRAAARHAYGLAADLYALALEGRDAGDASLLRARAHALEKCARLREAADAWSALAQVCIGDERIDAELHETFATLAIGDARAGWRKLAAVLQSAGETMPGQHVISQVWTLLQLTAGPSISLERLPWWWGAVRRTQARLLQRREASGWRVTRVATGMRDRAQAERNIKVGMVVAFLDPPAGMASCSAHARGSCAPDRRRRSRGATTSSRSTRSGARRVAGPCTCRIDTRAARGSGSSRGRSTGPSCG